MSSLANHTPAKKATKTPPVPIPSSSVLLISPTNQILLLHRVRTASAFSSAHVFPGGALSPEHDGELPDAKHPSGNQDSLAYRMAAIRETFEESGILLAKSLETGKLFTEISDEEREEGRKAVHAGTILFPDLLAKWGCKADVESLSLFTRWITPTNVPKRFTTQMYLYFLPLGSPSPAKRAAVSAGTPPSSGLNEEDEIVIPNPTHDGGIEHTAARFLPPNKWIDLARQNRVILYPPQFFLTYILSKYLSPTVTSSSSPTPSVEQFQKEREALLQFLQQKGIHGNDSAETETFGDAIISPIVLGRGDYGESKQDGIAALSKDTAVLVLDSPGRELASQGVRGSMRKWVITTKFKKEGPRDVDVVERRDLLGRDRTEEKL